MDRSVIVAVLLLVFGALLTIGASSFRLMDHHDAKVFVVAGGALAILLLLATGRKRRNGS